MIIWLASYPKSGNTWLRLFLKSYFSKPESELNINKFATDNFKCDSFPNLSLLEKLNVDYLKFEEIVKNWSSMQNFINLHNKINYVKTHNALCTVGPFKFTDKSQTAGAVYLIRDPRDVAVSYSHHLGICICDLFQFFKIIIKFTYHTKQDIIVFKNYTKRIVFRINELKVTFIIFLGYFAQFMQPSYYFFLFLQIRYFGYILVFLL